MRQSGFGQAIHWILFDFGEVLLQVHFHRANQAFRQLIADGLEKKPETVFYDRSYQSELFSRLERGHISATEFRNELRKALGSSVKDEELDRAWNSILGEPYPDRLDILQRLRSCFRLALLSNTNIIHYEAFRPGAQAILDQFEHCFLSFEMGMRKPDREIYISTLDRLGIHPEQALFIDDSAANVASAAALGIQTVHLEHAEALEHVCADLLQLHRGPL